MGEARKKSDHWTESLTALGYIEKVATERLFSFRADKDISNLWAIRNGKEMEETSINALQKYLGDNFVVNACSEVFLNAKDEAFSDKFGGTPDAIVKNKNGDILANAEIKNRESLGNQVKSLFSLVSLSSSQAPQAFLHALGHVGGSSKE